MLYKFGQHLTDLDLLRMSESCDGLPIVASPHTTLHG